MSALSQILVVHMATVVLESLLYGVFLVCASAIMYLRISRHNGGRTFLMRRDLVTLFTMAILPTCTTFAFFHAFLGPTGASEYYLEDWRRPQVTQSALTSVAILIGDAVIIHRLWLIWNRDIRLVIVPCVSWLAVFACGTAVHYLLSDPSENRIFLLSTLHWVQANWILSLVLVYPFTSQPYHLTPFQD
ncbi:hypothetical protein B0H16DRAFT_1789632 [Mycena metata]|uniref:Uncharacterized protein n=1 Tax=Mycena metata TaxID=1033252 RepID=A0AAD7MLA6_9AGAR|nr:hypothetical protein B0H16DRAFT_1789632 [Mycena metata]